MDPVGLIMGVGQGLIALVDKNVDPCKQRAKYDKLARAESKALRKTGRRRHHRRFKRFSKLEAFWAARCHEES